MVYGAFTLLLSASASKDLSELWKETWGGLVCNEEYHVGGFSFRCCVFDNYK